MQTLSYRNRMLASISPGEILRIAPHLFPHTFSRGQILHDIGQRVETMYFLEDGVCSMVTSLADGSMIEAALIGREGFVGMAALLGTGHSLNRSFMQVGGYGFSIKAKILLDRASPAAGEMHHCLERGVHGMLAQTSQTTACNRVHGLEERLARWLLMCHDRMQNDHLPITHELLAVVLGTGRSTVSAIAGILRKAGLIEYVRGHVIVLDRLGLERAACECYAIVHDEYVRLGLLEARRSSLHAA